MGVAATGTVRANRMENTPLRGMVKMNKKTRGSSDVVTDVPSYITAIRWKDNKVVDAISTFTGKPLQQVKRYCHRNTKQPKIKQYSMFMGAGGIDCMDPNVLAYMINLRTTKWWWPLFCFVVDAAVNNAYQIYCQSHLNYGEYRVDYLGVRGLIVDVYYRLYRKNLLSTTLFTGGRSLRHPPRVYSDGVAY